MPLEELEKLLRVKKICKRGQMVDEGNREMEKLASQDSHSGRKGIKVFLNKFKIRYTLLADLGNPDTSLPNPDLREFEIFILKPVLLSWITCYIG